MGIQSFNIETWQKWEEELAVFNYLLNSTAIAVTGKTSAAVSATEVSEANPPSSSSAGLSGNAPSQVLRLL